MSFFRQMYWPQYLLKPVHVLLYPSGSHSPEFLLFSSLAEGSIYLLCLVRVCSCCSIFILLQWQVFIPNLTGGLRDFISLWNLLFVVVLLFDFPLIFPCKFVYAPNLPLDIFLWKIDSRVTEHSLFLSFSPRICVCLQRCLFSASFSSLLGFLFLFKVVDSGNKCFKIQISSKAGRVCVEK